ncbi:hypothetical protein KUCAC02_003440 [Chaenocephalus aceratus]|uniref:Uncharacterized protein n=1 Tax=Chaenocephalus aceratus TaxID=36190 RepID=A0ACB9WKJ5_CHAAC|nr:hypothetical protein KUCAC02_003440 [Chaenocephalus aceratus]
MNEKAQWQNRTGSFSNPRCSLDRANKSRPVTCSMAPFEEGGKFGQSEEKGRRSFFSQPEQLPACDRQEGAKVKVYVLLCGEADSVLEGCVGTLDVVMQLTLLPPHTLTLQAERTDGRPSGSARAAICSQTVGTSPAEFTCSAM